MVKDAHSDDEKSGETQTDGIDRHDAGKGGVEGKDDVNPEESRATDTTEDTQSRNETETETSQVAGEGFDEDRKNVRDQNIAQTDHADADNLLIRIEESEQFFPAGEHEPRGGTEKKPAESDRCPKRAVAASELICTEILSYNGRAGLTEGTCDAVGEHFQIVRRGGGSHDDSVERIDGKLHADIGNREHHALHTGGNADTQDFTQAGRVNMQVVPLELHVAFSSAEQEPENGGAGGIRRHRGDGNPVH